MGVFHFLLKMPLVYNEKPEHLFPMGSETLPKQFIFNAKMDKAYLR